MDFDLKYKEFVEEINNELNRLVPEKDVPEKEIYTAMRYSLMARGKRIRPVLFLAVSEMLGGNKKEAMPFACTIEMIHTYSLIHDDLPAMDNDDYRRGRLTNHKVFGEAKAILAGDALLNYAFEVMSSHAVNEGTNLLNKLKAIGIIAGSSGVFGMIGGQVVDMESQNKKISADLLRYMHERKTGALIKASVLAAAVLSGADQNQLEDLEIFSEKIGLAFQIKDDILDVEGSFEDLGKCTGSDENNAKSTFVSIHGLEKSKGMLAEVSGHAQEKLRNFGDSGVFLRSLTEFLIQRNK